MTRQWPNARQRRGNTIVLVAAILVLLVVIATAFVTRTQAARGTASAVQRIEIREATAQTVANTIAREISGALFVRPLSLNPVAASDDQSNWPRLPAGELDRVANAAGVTISPTSVRYGIDPLNPYNFAPYHTVPFTNWPDSLSAPDFSFWPHGPGMRSQTALVNGLNALAYNEYNPVGGPGIGDSRWLANNEPMRWQSTDIDLFQSRLGILNDIVDVVDLHDAYSHWTHLSNLSRSDNGLRIVTDIADIFDSDNDGLGQLVENLAIPVEQWLTDTQFAQPAIWPQIGPYGDHAYHPFNLESQFFNLFFNYAQAYARVPNNLQQAMPRNFIRLADTNGDGFSDPVQESPAAEFVEGSMRWYVSRFLADTDGDGYTDAFWHLWPEMTDGGVRHLVAVRIVDTCGRINVNTATRFVRSDLESASTLGSYPSNNFRTSRTIGSTPADVALISADHFAANNQDSYLENVGFFDSLQHNEAAMILDGTPAYGTGAGDGGVNVAWRDGWGDPSNSTSSQWGIVLRELGIEANSNLFPNQLLTDFERRMYWQMSGSRPGGALNGPLYFSPDSLSVLSPFGLSDELELAMYHGHNYPWVLSRLEYAFNRGTGTDFQLRSYAPRQETSEFRQQLTNRELRYDLRKHVTTYSKARNELMPPWLWPGDLDDSDDPQVPANKIDLRAAAGDWSPSALREVLDECFVHEQDFSPLANLFVRQSYFGQEVEDVVQSELLATSFAANLTDFRDADLDPTIVDHPDGITADQPIERFMGMEPQPFLTEAVIGHIYQGYDVPNTGADGSPWGNAGSKTVFRVAEGCAFDNYSTVVVVQIANPFNEPIRLNNYRITVAGNSFRLAAPNDLGEVIDPSLENLRVNANNGNWEREPPQTKTYYAIREDIGSTGGAGGPDSLHPQWYDFLDLDDIESIISENDGRVVRVPSANDPLIDPDRGGWEIESQDHYDNDDLGIVLERLVDLDGNNQLDTWVVVDRFDSLEEREFNLAVKEMEVQPPPLKNPFDDQELCDPAAAAPDIFTSNFQFPGVEIAAPGESFDHWVQFVRVSRAWGIDVDNSGTYEDTERNPRYVFGDRVVVRSSSGGFRPGTRASSGHRFVLADDPDPSGGVSLPWFERTYKYWDASGNSVDVPFSDDPLSGGTPAKPFFFDLNTVDGDTTGAFVRGFPDKGWYGQYDPDELELGDPDELTENELEDDLIVNGELTLRQPYSMQMLLKNWDFDQVGEIYNVWLYGHALGRDETGLVRTEHTFSEFMSDAFADRLGRDLRVNRLRTAPVDGDGDGELDGGLMIGAFSEQELADVGVTVTPEVFAADVRHSMPALPAGLRVFDAFICDGPGAGPDVDLTGDNIAESRIDQSMLYRYNNAMAYQQLGTPGLININTAAPEVLRALPHWYRLMNGEPRFNDQNWPRTQNEYSRLPEAVMLYRERRGFPNQAWDPNDPGGLEFVTAPRAPGYADRGSYIGLLSPLLTDGLLPGLRGDRGFASAAELQLLQRSGKWTKRDDDDGTNYFTPYDIAQVDQMNVKEAVTWNQSWRIDFATRPDEQQLFADINDPAIEVELETFGMYKTDPLVPNNTYVLKQGVDLSTDVNGERLLNTGQLGNPDGTIPLAADPVAADVEEANLLFAGASNIVTTRSDTFLVYFKLRSFKQDPITGRWDALKKANIVDDARYVMLVDRSEVNKPTDEPKILFLEKVPN